MSAIAYHLNQHQEDVQQDPVNANIFRLFSDIGSTDQHYRIVAKSLELVNEPFIEEYIRNTIGPTHNFGLEHVETFAINRPEDRIEFMDQIKDRRLLWHGTRNENIYKILRDGFNLDLAKKSGMFGPGIYTSDCVTKAVNYAERGHKQCNSCSYSYLFLCEVALGKIRSCKRANYHVRDRLGSANSVWGQGYYKSSTAKYWTDPEGQAVMICPGPMRRTKKHYLEYNEYIVYYTSQIRLRYLVKVRHTSQERTVPKQVPKVFPMYQTSIYPNHQVTVKPYNPQVEPEEADDISMSNTLLNSVVANALGPLVQTAMQGISTYKRAPNLPLMPPSFFLPPANYPAQQQGVTNPILTTQYWNTIHPNLANVPFYATNFNTMTTYSAQNPPINPIQMPISTQVHMPVPLNPPAPMNPKINASTQATTSSSAQNSLKYVLRSTNNPTQSYTLSPANNPVLHQPSYSFNSAPSKHSAQNPPPTGSLNSARVQLNTSTQQVPQVGSAQYPIIIADNPQPTSSIIQQVSQNQNATNDLDDLSALDDICSYLAQSTNGSQSIRSSKQTASKPLATKRAITKSPSNKNGSKSPRKSTPCESATGSRQNPIQIDS